jgi:hypothetical protein
MTSKNTILYAGTMKLNRSILSWFNGSEYFCIDNPWFPLPGGVQAQNEKSWMVFETKEKNASKYVIKNPVIYARTSTDSSFTKAFEIGYCKDAKTPKEYRVFGLYEPENISQDIRRVKVNISPNTREFSLDVADEKIITLNYQIHVIIDILMACTLFGLNIKKMITDYNKVAFKKKLNEEFQPEDNKHFIICFIETIVDMIMKKDETVKTKDLVIPLYILNNWDSFNNNSLLFGVDSNKNIRPTDDEEQNIRHTLFGFIKFVASSGKLKGKIFDKNKQFNDIIALSHHYSIPSCYIGVYENKDGDVKQAFKGKFSISISPNESVGDSWKYTQTVKRVDGKVTCVPITRQGALDFTGVSNNGSINVRSIVRVGCLYIKPSIFIGLYGLGNVKPDYAIRRIATKVQTNVMTEDLEGIQFLGEDDEDINIDEELAIRAFRKPVCESSLVDDLTDE